MSKRYTKADLEQIVYKQLDNLNAMHDLLRIMKVQNDLIQNINQTLREEIGQFKEQQVMYGQGRDGKFIRNRSRPPSLQCVVNSHIVPLSLSLSLSLSRTHLLANRRCRKRGHHRENVGTLTSSAT